MEWKEIQSDNDIEELHKVYGNFLDSFMVKFELESGNYVDDDRVGHAYDNNILIIRFERMDDNPFSIELMFEHTHRINYLFSVWGKDEWASDIVSAKVARNDDYFYWTEWMDFDPYNEEHLKYNDFILIEAVKLKWRIIK